MATKDNIERLRMRGENARSKKAFLDYIALGPNRSLRMLLAIYRDPAKYTQEPRSENAPPTRQMATLRAWSSAYNWQGRLHSIRDDQIQTLLTEQNRHLVQTMQNAAYAQKANRIQALNDMAVMLMERVQKTGMIRTIVKVVGSGKNPRIIEEESVDVDLVVSLRGLFADLAAETGGRVKKTIIDPKRPLVDNRSVFILPAIGKVEDVEGEVYEIPDEDMPALPTPDLEDISDVLEETMDPRL